MRPSPRCPHEQRPGSDPCHGCSGHGAPRVFPARRPRRQDRTWLVRQAIHVRTGHVGGQTPDMARGDTVNAATPELVTLTIDDVEVSVPKGTGLVEAAAAAGIEIPVFCYEP